MNALLAIKPLYAEKILAGEKNYEFRRTTFRETAEIELIYLYASSPVKKIVGLFISERVMEASPGELWDLFGAESGIENREQFMSYFDGVDTGYAIEVTETHRLQQALDPHALFDEFSPPMSFHYLTDEQDQILRQYVPKPIWRHSIPTTLTRYTIS